MNSRLVVGLILSLVLVTSGWTDELKTLTGKVSGTLEKISDSVITFKTSAAPASTPLAQALDLYFRPGKTNPTVPSYIETILLDDSLLRCTSIKFGVKDTQLVLSSGPSVSVPNSGFITILRDAHDAGIRDQWKKLLANKKRTDRIFVLNMGSLNPISGSLGAIDEAKQTIYFKPDVEGAPASEPELAKLHGMQFVRTDVPSQQSLCEIIDIDGNRLVASKLSYDGGPLQVTTPFGAKVDFDLKLVASINFNFGKLTYLSDLEAKLQTSVFLGGFNPVRKDANLDGYPIMLQDKKYEKGLSIYAGAELEYPLGGNYKEFKAILGADSRIAEEGQGKVTVSIYCDRQKVFTKEVSTQTAVPLAINVKDVGSLRIVVSGPNITTYSGHATLANAHVSK